MKTKLILKVIALTLAVSASAQTIIKHSSSNEIINDKIPSLVEKIENIQFSNLNDIEKKMLLQKELNKFLIKNDLNKKIEISNILESVAGKGNPGI